MHDAPRLIILANTSKPQVTAALRDLRPWLAERGTIVAEPDLDTLSATEKPALPEADLALVLGGDGTMLSQARYIVDYGIPILGVNFGKIGFLAEFDLNALHQHWDTIVAGRCRTTRRLMLEIMVFNTQAADCCVDELDADNCRFRALGLNDAVINAGEPFRMIELEFAVQPTDRNAGTTHFSGDGVIIATPSGSTAHNVSAGGPIISPGIEAMCFTPICPHSLAFRPIIVHADEGVRLRVNRANPGTHLVIDGQVSRKLKSGEQVYIRRHAKPLILIQHPEVDYWHMLAQKMHWAASPGGNNHS